MDRFQEMQVFARIAERHSFQGGRGSADSARHRHQPDQAPGTAPGRAAAGAHHAPGPPDPRRRDLLPALRVRLLADLEEADGAFLDKAPKGLLRVNAQGTLARYFVMPGCPVSRATPTSRCTWARTTATWTWCVKAWTACCAPANCRTRRWRAAHRTDAAGDGGQPGLSGAARRAGRTGGPGRALGGELPVQRHGPRHDHGFPGRWPQRAARGGQRERGRAVHGRGPGRAGIDPGAALPRGAGAGGRPAAVVLPHLPPAPMPVSVLYPQNRQVSARVRVFTQWLAQRFEAAFGADMPVR